MSDMRDLTVAAVVADYIETPELGDAPGHGRTARIVAAALCEERERVIARERLASAIAAVDAYMRDVLLWRPEAYVEERAARVAAIVAILTMPRCASPSAPEQDAIRATLEFMGMGGA